MAKKKSITDVLPVNRRGPPTEVKKLRRWCVWRRFKRPTGTCWEEIGFSIAARIVKNYGCDDPIRVYLKAAMIDGVPEGGRRQRSKDDLIDKLTGGLENVKSNAEIDIKKLKTLDEVIRELRTQLSDK